jgi:serine protease Do
VTTGRAGENAVIRAKDKVAPALVHIRPVKEVFQLGKREEVLVIGSGFIISPDGYVVTNEHVAGKSTSVRCVLGNKDEVDAKVVGTDPYTDIAVLKLDVGGSLPVAKMGDSGKLVAGETVLALGSPHGLSRSVSAGIVSVTDRYLDAGGPRSSPFNNFIQTDAAINPGNSGGPLVNLKGEVVGVNARVLSGAENVGFAIPIDTAKAVVDQIIKHGHVQRSWVGIDFQEMLARTEDHELQGVVIADVDPLSPAADAQLRPGDILTAVNGVKLNARFEEDLPEVANLVASLPVGSDAAFSILRDGKPVDVQVHTEERGDLRGAEKELKEWGLTVAELTPEMVRRAQLPARAGVFVSGTQVGGIASNARLDMGDVILKIDGQDIGGLDQFQELYNAVIASKKKLVLLWVKRGALTRYVLVKQEAPAPAENAPAADQGGSNHGG